MEGVESSLKELCFCCKGISAEGMLEFVRVPRLKVLLKFFFISLAGWLCYRVRSLRELEFSWNSIEIV